MGSRAGCRLIRQWQKHPLPKSAGVAASGSLMVPSVRAEFDEPQAAKGTDRDEVSRWSGPVFSEKEEREEPEHNERAAKSERRFEANRRNRGSIRIAD